MEIIAAEKQLNYSLSDFEKAVEGIDSLETMPVVAQRLMQLTSDPDFSMNDLHELVKSDQVIAARILRVASSSVYGSRPATNLRAALIRIGMKDLRKLVMASAMMGKKQDAFTQELWRYSLKVASIVDCLASLLGTQDLQDPFLCGLMHDFGSVLMNKVMGKDYRAVLTQPGCVDQVELEERAFGFSHCDLGVMAAQSWKLFAALEDVMQHHHQPLLAEELGLPESSQKAIYLVAAARLGATEGLEEEPLLVEELCDRLNLTEDELAQCQSQGLERFEESYAALIG